VRWAEYHRLFDIDQAFPRVAGLVSRLRADEALAFATEVELGKAPKGSGAFLGHLAVEEAVQGLL
ncbi:MAG: glutathione S-transferase, partial [Burkholderiaceae bacterium]